MSRPRRTRSALPQTVVVDDRDVFFAERFLLLGVQDGGLEKLLLRHEALLLSDGGERPSISLPS